MGRFPHDRPAAADATTAIGADGSVTQGDAADVAFEALRAGARAPLTDAVFESLRAHLKALECPPPPGRCGALPPASPPSPQRHEQVDGTMWRETIRGVTEDLAQLHRRLTQAPEVSALRQLLLDELARLATNLNLLLHRGKPEAVLVAAATGGWRFALPLATVETVRSVQEPLPEGLAAHDPRRWWEAGSQDVAASDAARYWVIVTTGSRRRRAALAVSALYGVCRAPASDPGPMLAASGAVAGVVRDAEGNAAVLLRLEELLTGEDIAVRAAKPAPDAGP